MESEDEDSVFEMVQGSYGIVPQHPAEPGASSGGEQSALLGGDRDSSAKRLVKPDGHASVISCISNLTNTIIGSGEPPSKLLSLETTDLYQPPIFRNAHFPYGMLVDFR